MAGMILDPAAFFIPNRLIMIEKPRPYKQKKRGFAKSKKGKSASSRERVMSSLALSPNPTFKSNSLLNYEILSRNLDTADFVVFDIETTGGNPEKNGITEIFGVRFVGGEVQDKFYSMVNPEIPIPKIVRKMTGITNEMVKDAPKIDQVMGDIIKFCSDSILVSHNTIGDLKFLRHFSYKVCEHNLNNFFLCTHLLAEKLVASAPDKSLKGLAEHLGFSRDTSHRAETDTYMTLDLFKELMSRLKSDESIIDLETAVRFQGDLESALRLGWSVAPKDIANIPNCPGLFYLYGRSGELLFFASSQNIARDVKGLKKYDQLPKQLLKRVLSTHSVSTKKAGHILEALIEEATDERASSLHYSPSQWHLRVVYVVQAVKEGSRYRLFLGAPKSSAEFLYGKVFDRKDSLAILANIADVFGVDDNKKGIFLEKYQLRLVKAYMDGLLDDLRDSLQWKKFNPIYWLSTAKRSALHNELKLVSNLRSLPRVGLKDLKMAHGFVIVNGQMHEKLKPTDANVISKIYPVMQGQVLDPDVFNGTFEDWKNSEQSSLVLREMRDSIAGKKLRAPHDGRLNVGLWVATSKQKKNDMDIRYETFPWISC